MPILLLFDIDGTILKLKEGISKRIFKNALKQTFGIEIDDENQLPDFAGKTDPRILKEIIAKFCDEYNISENKINEFWQVIYHSLEKYCTRYNIILMPGIRELLQKLSANRNILLGLLTGNLKENAYLKLKAFELDKYFPFGSFGSDNEDRNKLPPIAIMRANEYISNDISSSFIKTGISTSSMSGISTSSMSGISTSSMSGISTSSMAGISTSSMSGISTGSMSGISTGSLSGISTSSMAGKIFDNSNTMIIGDSPGDIECANSNGILSLAVATGSYSYDELKKYHPSLIVENFSDYNYVISYILEQYGNI